MTFKRPKRKYSTTERVIKFLFPDTMESNLGDFIEIYNEKLRSKGLLSAYICFAEFILKSFPSVFVSRLYRRSTMFKNYLKTAFRINKRRKGFSLINILGLSAGFTCCIFIIIYIQYETSWDSFHKDAERKYRLVSAIKKDTGILRFQGVAPALKVYISENIPQAEKSARFWTTRDADVKIGDKLFREKGQNIAYTDRDLIDIFTLPIIYGDSSHVLSRPGTAVISQTTARKYFGDEDPVGKIIRIDTTRFEVSSVVQNPRGNSVLKFNILIPWESNPFRTHLNGWGGFVQTYVKLGSEVDKIHFKSLVTKVMNDKNESAYNSRGEEYSVEIQSISDIYLHSSDISSVNQAQGSLTNIYIFGWIAFIIILIASINFTNLSTARSVNRACEVGMRKVAGANRGQLIFQFICESILTVSISYFIALVTAIILFSPFRQLTLIDIELSGLFNMTFISSSIFMIFFIGIAAGCYPAFILSSFKPSSVLKGSVRTGLRSGNIRKILVVGQFALSIIMLAGSIIFSQQLDYMKNASLGFEKERKLIINMEGNKIGPKNYSSIKEEFLSIPAVQGASFSSSVPGKWLYHWRIWPYGEQQTNTIYLRVMTADEDFFSLYDLDIIKTAGSNADMSDFSVMSWMINESAVKAYGWENPDEAVVKTLKDGNLKIAGVYKDFHFTGLQELIEPQAIGFIIEDFRFLSLKVSSIEVSNTISLIESKYKMLFSERVFECYFLDEDFNRLYLKEERVSKIFGIFTMMGILIAYLGLFGMAAYAAQQRTKEIGIRKVLGSTVNGIAVLLLKEFIYLIIISIIIAWPVSYYIMNIWLQDFAYRISIPIWSFFLSGMTAVLIALLSSGFQSFKAARTDPVNSLRYE